MARKNVSKVVKAWLDGKSATGPKGSVSTDGKTIFSYAMPIAVRTGAKAVIVSSESPSVTTTIHRNNVQYLLGLEGYAVAKGTGAEVKSISRAA